MSRKALQRLTRVCAIGLFVLLIALVGEVSFLAAQDVGEQSSARKEAGAPPSPGARKLSPNPLKDLKAGLKGVNGLNGFGGAKGGDSIRLGGRFQITEGSREGILSIKAELAPTWHVYSITQKKGGTLPSKLKVASSSDFEVTGPFEADRDPKVHTEEFFPVPIEEHEGQVIWSAPIRLNEGVDPNSLTVEVRYDGQVCQTDGVCIPVNNRLVVAKFAGFLPIQASGVEQYRAERSHVVIQGNLEPSVLRPGQKAILTFTATPDENWHIYAHVNKYPMLLAKATVFGFAKTSGWKITGPQVSAAPVPHLTGLEEEKILYYHEKTVSWTYEITVPGDAAAGEYKLLGAVGYQTCTDETCDLPAGAKFDVIATVGESASEGAVSLTFVDGEYAEAEKLARQAPIENVLASNYDFSFWGISIGLLTAFLGGLILNVMPCVLPVIGLKVMAFVQQAGQSRFRVLSLNIWYAIGMWAVFMVFASAAVFLKLAYGSTLTWASQFSYPGFSIPLAAFVFVFGLSLFGVWEIPIPGFAGAGKANELSAKEGLLGAFFKGAFTTVLATPCSGPFLGVAIGFAVAAPIWLTYTAFTSMSLGMAFPYLLIGVFPALIKWLPKPGVWMDTFKQLMGFVLMGTVVWFIYFIDKQYTVATLMLFVGLSLACWHIGRTPLTVDFSVKAKTWAGAAAISIASFLLAFGSFFIGAESQLPWEPFSRAALQAHLDKGEAVFVDFTADS